MKKISKSLYYLDDILAGICLLLIILVTFSNVFMRYVMQAPLAWAEEVNMALVVWFVCIGASSATKRAAHVAIDFFVEQLRPPAKKIVEIFILVVSIVVLVLLGYWGFLLAIQAGLKVTNLLKIPFFFVDLALPLGCSFMILHLIAIERKKLKVRS